jgi:predicted unusual protein kinase regulating ubiquinone biosynthesis (AarF/ABC1/UbiB family)
MQTENVRNEVLFVEVTLARVAACDACTGVLSRGARVHLVADGRASPRVRCRPCFDCCAEPLPIAASIGAAPLAVASSAALVRVSPLAWLAIAGAASLATLLASRTARRLAVTIAVALKSAWRMAVARVRGKKDAAPIVVRQAFEELGPTYVKLGQLVASSQGIFPERYCREFQGCLDRVKSFPFRDVEATLREELGCDPAEIFASLDPEPLASASIAQVHAARLKDGDDVVVKVQRPHIAETIAADLRILRGVARVFAMLPHGELANPVDIVDDFEANLHEELDFVHEAANMDEFNRIMVLHNQDEVAAPRVVHRLTTKRVLVMERFYGHRVDDVAQLRASAVDGEAKLLLGMRAWFQSMIFHGFFHGDVHAGNLMALRDGRIGFLDFGIVGRFPPERRTQVTDYLMSFASGDYAKLAETMVAMGSVGKSVDMEAFARDLKEAYGPMLDGTMDSIKYADLIPAIMRVAIKHEMRLPRDFVLITKQMLYFDRYAKVLAPKLNIFKDPRIVTALAMDVMMASQMQLSPA